MTTRKGPPAPLLVIQDLVFFLVAGCAHGLGLAWPFLVLPWFIAAPISVVTYPLTVILVVTVLDRLVPAVPVGVHPMGGPLFIAWGVHLVLYRVARIPPAIWLIKYSNVLRFLWLTGLRGRVHFSSQMSGDTNLLDHQPFSLGAGAVVGSETMISTHILVKEGLHVGGVHIGANALVAARCLLAPGVEIGEGATLQVGNQLGLGVKVGARAHLKHSVVVDSGCTIGEGAIIEARSYLPSNTHVPPGERWSGAPARRVDDVTAAL